MGCVVEISASEKHGYKRDKHGVIVKNKLTTVVRTFGIALGSFVSSFVGFYTPGIILRSAVKFVGKIN